jgi:hypothetical protein
MNMYVYACIYVRIHACRRFHGITYTAYVYKKTRPITLFRSNVYINFNNPECDI